jgi:hypothetical protein
MALHWPELVLYQVRIVDCEELPNEIACYGTHEDAPCRDVAEKEDELLVVVEAHTSGKPRAMMAVVRMINRQETSVLHLCIVSSAE